jgi:hypothetical protein
MPKKTKREKLLAQQRRYAAAASSLSSGFSFSVSERPTGQTETYTEELTVIRHDLVRTIIFACIAVLVEFGIYWKINGG